MSPVASRLPRRHPGLVIRPQGEHGPYVVKEPKSGAYYQLGAEEHFLLTQLDGRHSAETLCAAFGARFGSPLPEPELGEFIEMARAQRLLEPLLEPRPRDDERQDPPRQTLLCWRKCLFDPDRFLGLLEPRLRFFWTWTFLIASANSILFAALLAWAARQEIAGSFHLIARWENLVLLGITLFTVAMLHEMAHGLTCKHYGGEVHEIGFLLLCFMPCFYCNVSDAWLFPEKSKRLWVTLAGGYFELFLWACAVVVWRVTMPETRLNTLAFVIVCSCGIQSLFNFNPLLKLDGYYLLSDWMEIPNLRRRSLEHLQGHVRWLLWGSARPEHEPRGRFLFGFGLATWLYSLVFLALTIFFLWRWWKVDWGPIGVVLLVLLGSYSLRTLFRGFSAGEFMNMIAQRRGRVRSWFMGLGGLAALCGLVRIEDRASGPFRLRSSTRAELRAPVAGFVREIYVDEGVPVARGTPIVRLEDPDRVSRLTQKCAERREVLARLRLLEEGPRREERDEQRRRVERSRHWRDLARQDLARSGAALKEELIRLEKQVAAAHAERDAACGAYHRTRSLLERHAIAVEDLREAESKYRVNQARVEQAEAELRSREAQGTLQAEAELARREKELGDAESALALIEAGTRPEEIEAERARLARLDEEVGYLRELQARSSVVSPATGLVTTPRLRERAGQYVQHGDLICVIEDPASFEAQITLAEDDLPHVRVGQQVRLKARPLLYETLTARLERVAPAADDGGARSTVSVFCRLEPTGRGLQSGTTGFARVYTQRRPIGAIVFDRVYRVLRTEFWW
jgi:multidrug resistance efflux pump